MLYFSVKEQTYFMLSGVYAERFFVCDVSVFSCYQSLFDSMGFQRGTCTAKCAAKHVGPLTTDPKAEPCLPCDLQVPKKSPCKRTKSVEQKVGVKFSMIHTSFMPCK